MAKTKQLISTLKKLLKQRGVTYAYIAKQLNLSETSIKRMFSQQNFSLERLDTICGMLDMDFVDLLRVYDDEQEKISSLTIEQETELVSDLKFLLVASCVQHAWSYKEIMQHYNFTDSECIAYLIRLDKLGLIELLPNNKIRRMVAQNFHWLSGGPIEQFFATTIQTEFLDANFSEQGEQRLYLSGSLTSKSIDLLNKKLTMLAAEFMELQNDDQKLPVAVRKGTGLMLAMRSWESTVFRAFKRQNS